MDKELGLWAAPEIGEIGPVHGNSEADELSNAPVAATRAKANPRAEAEAGEQQWHARKLLCEKIDGRAHISFLAAALIMDSGTKPGAAEIEAQDGETQRVERFGGLINDFIVECAAEERVRMTDDRRERGRQFSGRTPEHSFEPAGWTSQKQIARFVPRSAHSRFSRSTSVAHARGIRRRAGSPGPIARSFQDFSAATASDTPLVSAWTRITLVRTSL